MSYNTDALEIVLCCMKQQPESAFSSIIWEKTMPGSTLKLLVSNFKIFTFLNAYNLFVLN